MKGTIMHSLKGERIIVTGGSSGLGLGLVEALVERQARGTVVDRDTQRLAEVERRLGVAVAACDITERERAASLLSKIQPSVVVLNAGATPRMLPLHEQT